MKKVTTEARRLSIWDNFERIKAELLGLGAGEAQIEELRVLAQAVEDADSSIADTPDIPTITEPRQCANGWTVAPPTKQSVFYATLCAEEAVGGVVPTTSRGQAMAIIAGLWALRECGDGRVREVARVVSSTGEIQRVAADLLMENKVNLDSLADDYLVLMGFRVPGAKAQEALRAFLEKRSEIMQSCVASSRPPPTGNPA